MKHINVIFEDNEFEQLWETKGRELSWHDFIMTLTEER